jgi:DMSO/TMAO reductase YedYZ molybdopterin-dependent catalytic subunit
MPSKTPNSQRLPPGQKLSSGFPTLHYGRIPNFNPATWDFRVWGAVEIPIVWTWDQILDLPRTKIQLDLHCVTTWSILDTEWEGISPKTLVQQGLIRLKPEARFVMQHADYGYTTNLPLSVFLGDNFLLATHFSGKPLTPEHGYPLRGVVGAIPGRRDLKDVYLWKGAKWLRGLEFLTEDRLGFWEANGYHNQADVWKEQRRSG